jgi:hypothetical protein
MMHTREEQTDLVGYILELAQRTLNLQRIAHFEVVMDVF